MLTNTQNITTTYPAEIGHTYAFRVRATDKVSNTSAWVEGVAKTVVVKKYYHVAGQRVAMRSSNVLYWLHGDHLGSTSLTTNITGTVVAEQKYLPYGEIRWVTGTLATDFTYTSQRAEGFGLMDYHARFYSPYLARFVSPDTMVPDPTNFMEFSRYGYCLGNPVNYVDPTGHQVRFSHTDNAIESMALGGGGSGLSAYARVPLNPTEGGPGYVLTVQQEQSMGHNREIAQYFRLEWKSGFSSFETNPKHITRIQEGNVGYKVRKTEGGKESGQMLDEEVNGLKGLAKAWNVVIDICGSLGETLSGIRNRAFDDPSVPQWRRGLPSFRSDVDVSQRTIEAIEQSGGNVDLFLRQVWQVFYDSGFLSGEYSSETIDYQGYSTYIYGQDAPGGSLSITPDGEVIRNWGDWQK